MGDIAKVAAVAVIGAVCAVVVRRSVPELSMLLAICAGCAVLALAISPISELRAMLDTLAGRAGLEAALITPIVKTVGVAIITRVTVEICRDAGEGGIASFVEISGAAIALIACLPLMRMVIEMVIGLT